MKIIAIVELNKLNNFAYKYEYRSCQKKKIYITLELHLKGQFKGFWDAVKCYQVDIWHWMTVQTSKNAPTFICTRF